MAQVNSKGTEEKGKDAPEKVTCDDNMVDDDDGADDDDNKNETMTKTIEMKIKNCGDNLGWADDG